MKRPLTEPAFPADELPALASYRVPMPVTEGLILRDGVYYLCPRCRHTVEREHMAFCDRCGQKLDWRGYKKARLSCPRSKQSSI